MRKYSPHSTEETKRLLNILIDPKTDPASYQDAMVVLGHQLGASVGIENPHLASALTCIACTVEDADFLARGFLEGLIESGFHADNVKLACFWNERVRTLADSNDRLFDVAPVLKQYREVADLRDSVVIMVKSIISGACVVKTNLAMLIDDVTPQRVFVAAPVMLEGAEARLASEFPAELATRFEYRTFAIDNEKGGDENVIPGIGGSVYERLGFDDKNSAVPQIVRERRERQTAQ